MKAYLATITRPHPAWKFAQEFGDAAQAIEWAKKVSARTGGGATVRAPGGEVVFGVKPAKEKAWT